MALNHHNAAALVPHVRLALVHLCFMANRPWSTEEDKPTTRDKGRRFVRGLKTTRLMRDWWLAYFQCARRREHLCEWGYCWPQREKKRSPSALVLESCSRISTYRSQLRAAILTTSRRHRRDRCNFIERDRPSCPVTIWAKSHELAKMQNAKNHICQNLLSSAWV